VNFKVSDSWILIEALTVDASIGVFDWEKVVRQSLVLDLRLRVRMESAGRSDAIADALSYAEVSDKLQHWIQNKHHDLLEYLGYQLLERVYDTYPEVTEIELAIRKPGAVPTAKAVGIQLSSVRSPS